MANVKGAVLKDIKALNVQIGDVVSAPKSVLAPYIDAGHIDTAKAAVEHQLKVEGRELKTWSEPENDDESTDDTTTDGPTDDSKTDGEKTGETDAGNADDGKDKE